MLRGRTQGVGTVNHAPPHGCWHCDVTVGTSHLVSPPLVVLCCLPRVWPLRVSRVSQRSRHPGWRLPEGRAASLAFQLCLWPWGVGCEFIGHHYPGSDPGGAQRWVTLTSHISSAGGLRPLATSLRDAERALRCPW